MRGTLQIILFFIILYVIYYSYQMYYILYNNAMYVKMYMAWRQYGQPAFLGFYRSSCVGHRTSHDPKESVRCYRPAPSPLRGLGIKGARGPIDAWLGYFRACLRDC